MQPNNETTAASLPPSVVQAAMRKSHSEGGVTITLSSDQIEAFSSKETGEEHVQTVTAAELRQIIERVERLEEEKAAVSGDIKDVLGEAKGRGYDVKAIRTIIRLRKKDANERIEEETILATYMAALGME